MKKFKVLKKCKPFLVKGTVLEETLIRKFTGIGISILIQNETIEEIKEPKWTDEDLVKFIEDIRDDRASISDEDFVETWIKENSQ